MDTATALKKRRSIREYTSKSVSIEAITKILDAANHAPSAGNIQNSCFILVEDEQKKEKIADASSKQMWLADAPLLIVVCSDSEQLKSFYKERADFYAIQNSALAVGNMLTMATSLGIATCFVSAFDEIKLRDILRIPGNIDVMALASFGYSKESPPILKKTPLQVITYFDAWGNRLRAQKSLADIAKKGKKKIKGLKSKLKKKFNL